MVVSRHVNDVDISRAAADQVELEVARMEEQLAFMREARQQMWSDAPDWRGAEPENEEELTTEGFDVERWQSRRQKQPPTTNEREDAQAQARADALERQMAAHAELQARQEEERLMQEADEDARIQAGCSKKEWSARKAKASKVARQAAKKQPWEWHGIDTFLANCGLASHGYGPRLRERGLDSPEALAAMAPAVFKKLGLEQKHEQRIKMGIAELRAFGVSSAAPSQCPTNLTVTGAEKTLQWDLMGIFTQIDMAPTVHQAERPVYRNTNGKHLYYWKNDEQWQIGDFFTESDCAAFSSGTTMCPTAASDWFLWDGNAWSDAVPITVKEAQAPLLAMAGVKTVKPAAGQRQPSTASDRPAMLRQPSTQRPLRQASVRAHSAQPAPVADAQRPPSAGKRGQSPGRALGPLPRRQEPKAAAHKSRPLPLPPASLQLARPSAAALRPASLGRR
eukprot:TRINITY_DN16505_c0_g1_i1.p1 TRINITY_DN16505_c0_g1~~TRINITY_DN16505_c0_g1_i1.p1  ORF type:complete len:460 (+),score=109.00 TRINITY_DN16505_c0_g1_i1:28-1380(+)